MKGLRIIDTGDGSHSLYNEALNETYHSRHGAIQESSYVFLRQGFDAHPADRVSVLEYGFGTGLNALLTLIAANEQQRQVRYTSLEAYPLTPDITGSINYSDLISHPRSADWFQQLHVAPWGEDIRVHEQFVLHKIETAFENYISEERFDLVYFDAFAPSRQPELWEQKMLKCICKIINSGGVFVTYSAMGQLKRDLTELGLTVETLEGPPGKKEMVRARKP